MVKQLPIHILQKSCLTSILFKTIIYVPIYISHLILQNYGVSYKQFIKTISLKPISDLHFIKTLMHLFKRIRYMLHYNTITSNYAYICDKQDSEACWLERSPTHVHRLKVTLDDVTVTQSNTETAVEDSSRIRRSEPNAQSTNNSTSSESYSAIIIIVVNASAHTEIKSNHRFKILPTT